jgi:hypothetical protein
VEEFERKLIWRGATVALPAREIDFVDDPTKRPLSTAEIASGIDPARTKLSDCVVQAVGAARLEARVTLEFLVDGKGRSGATRMHAPLYLFEHGLQPCLEQVVHSLQFTATGAPTIVTLPLELH